MTVRSRVKTFGDDIGLSNSPTLVASNTLPAGGYTVVATANNFMFSPNPGDLFLFVHCELHNGLGGVTGGTEDSRNIPNDTFVDVSLTNEQRLDQLGGWWRCQLVAQQQCAQ